MADVFKGLTLRIGADARPLNAAIQSIKKSASEANTQFNRLSKALQFDTTNVKAMESRLDLASDKAALTAVAATKIRTAVKQASTEMVTFSARSGLASGTMQKVANSTKTSFTAVQKLRAEFNHVDTELEQIYDACIKVARVKFDMSAEEATAHVQELQKALNKGGEAASKARSELVSLMKSAAFKTDITDMFGLEKNIGSASKLVGIWNKLRAAQKDYQADLEAMKHVEGFRTAETQLIAYESELRQACNEMAQFKAELYSIGGVSGLDKVTADTKQLDAAVDAASASASKMAEAFKQAPMSMEAARAKAVALRTEQNALEAKLQSVKAVIDKIGNSNGFDRQRALMSDVWTAAEKAKAAYSDTSARLETLKAEYDAVSQKIKEVEGHEKSLSAEAKSDLEVHRAKLQSLADNIQKVTSELRQTESVVKSTQLDKTFREASEEAVRLKSRIEQVNSSLKSISNYQSAFEGIRRIGYGLYTTVTQALFRVGRYAITSADEIDSAYRDMRKTVNATEEQFEGLKDAALEFSQTHVTSADQILEIESIGGQLGITADALDDFATTVSNLDIATNMETEDIALQLAKLSNILHFGQEEYDNFADALVRLGNNEPALESDIMKISTRFAGMAANVGMATSDVLAFATAATATGQKAEAAGGSMQRTLGRIEKAVASGGDALENFAKVSGMSAEEFTASWEDTNDHGPAKTLQAFILGLKGIKESGGSVTQTLADLGITGVRDTQLLEGLTNTTDVLADSLQMADDAWNGMSTTMKDGTVEQAGDAAREAGRKAEGFSGQLAIMQNNAQMLASELAEGATPIIKMLSDAFAALTGWVASLPDGLKTAVVAFGGFMAILGPVLVSIGAIGSAVTGIGKAIESIKSFSILKSAASSISGVVDSFRLTASAATSASKATLECTRSFGSMSIALPATATKAGQAATGLAKAGTSAASAGSLLSKLKVGVTGLTGSFAASIAVIAGVALVIGLVAKGFADQEERARKAKEATEGWARSIESTTPEIVSAKNDLELYNKAIEGSWRGVEELVDSSLELKDSIIERNKATQDDISKLETAQAVLHQYMNKSGLTADEQGRLAAAVALVNEHCGTQYEIVDIANGKLKDEHDQILENCDAIDAYITKKQLQMRADAILADLEGVNQEMSDSAKDIASYKRALSDVNAEIERLEGATDSEKAALYELNGEWVPYEAYLNSLYTEQSRLNYQMETATGIHNEQAAAADYYQKKLGNLLSATEGYASALSTAILANNDWASAFEGAGADFDTFRAALDSTTLTVEDLSNISFDQILDMAEMWREGGMTIEEVLASAGVSLRTFGEQFSLEMAESGNNFQGFADLLGTDTETLAQTLRDAGYSAIDFANLSDQMLWAAAEAAMASMEEGGDGVQAFIDKLAELGNTDVTAEAEIEYDEEGYDEFTEDAEEIDDTEVTATADFDVTDATAKLNEWNLKLDNVHDAESEVHVETSNAMSEIGKISDSILSVSRLSANPTVSVYDDATWRLHAIANTLSAITSVTHYVTVAERASGGIIGGYAKGAIYDKLISAIPMHASGALNGIVARPTLTNIGWVGEDGAEAILHMGHAGGAVIPLTNQRYVRPFAQAVAANMGTRPSVTVNMNLNYDASDDAQQMLRDIERGLENYLNLEA